MEGIIGKKIGMTSVYNELGQNVACTVIEAGPCVVTQVKTDETDGYNALQIGFGEAKEKNTTRALQGHYSKSGATPLRKVAEIRDSTLELGPGDEVTLDLVFAEGDLVDVVGESKGKGFQGVVKRHNFRGVGDATHGQHNRQRAPGAIGAGSDPSRVFKGMRMGGQTGGARVKMRNLRVVKLFPEKNLILVKGAVPGHKGSMVMLYNKR